MNTLKIGALIMCLSMLCSCSSAPLPVRYVPVTKTHYVLMPEALLPWCQITALPPAVAKCLHQQPTPASCMSNPQVLQLVISLYGDLGRCNLDNAAVKAWHQQKQQALQKDE